MSDNPVMSTLFSEAFSPPQIAERVENIGVAKAKADFFRLMMLGILAGAYISLGALMYATVMTGADPQIGMYRFIGGITFCLGLILVVVGGAELFTGNNLLAMAWASKLISTKELIRNWIIVYCGNVVGCIGTVILVYYANMASIMGGELGVTLYNIAVLKTGLSVSEMIARGVLCNCLVCMAVWLAIGGRSVTDKILAVIFPISAFVALGFEHSIANWFLLPLAYIIESGGNLEASAILLNIMVVTIGNIIGGSLLVASVYWAVYLRKS
jgi:formate transporter